MGPSRADKRADPLHYLPPTALQTLASILCYPTPDGNTQPTKEWLTQQQNRIYNLPRHLKLHRSVSLATFFSVNEVVSGRLCLHHRDLKPELIFWCYTQLNEEVSTHTDRYRRYREKFSDECTDELRGYIDRMTSIATLYLRRDDFEAEYGRRALAEDERYPRVRGGCAACVLSVVGARAQMLIDLRASMLARQKRRTPRLLCLVEAWMDEFPAGTLDMRRESEEVAAELRAFRARIAEVRGERGGERERYYEERDRRRRRRRQERGSMSRAITEFFGMSFGDRKKRHGSSGGSHHRWSSRRDSSSHRDTSSHHGSSTHRDSASHCDSSSRAGSTYSAYSSSRGPDSNSSGPQSEYVERHSSHPSSSASHVQTWDDGHAPHAGYDEAVPPSSSYALPYAEDVPDNATSRSSRYGSQAGGGSEASSSSRYSRNPYRQSFPSDRRPEFTASQHTIRPSSYLHPPAPDSDRYSWTSSVYSTDNNGLRAGDAGFRATGNGYAVRKPLEAVIENLELEADDVPLDPDGYDGICCPSSDSEDGGDDGDEEHEQEQYVGARSGWAAQSAPDNSPTEVCPLCQDDLAGLTLEQRNRHCNSCIDGKTAPLPQRGERPTVSGIGRMVDEVIDGFGRLSTIDEAAEQFTPRPSVASRVRREFQGSGLNSGSVHRAGAGGGSRRMSGYAPSTVGVGVLDDEISPDDSHSVAGFAPGRPARETRGPGAVGRGSGSVAGSSASRRSALGGGRFRNVVRER
jgi:hypothetical protein